MFIGSAVQHSILPAFTILISSVSGWILSMRNMMVTVAAEDYITVAHAKGLPERRVALAYAARNALLPNVSGFALSLGFIVGGTLLVEIVFSYPGLGFQLFQAVGAKDYPLMQGVFLVITLSVLAANLLADLAYLALDPRTRKEAEMSTPSAVEVVPVAAKRQPFRFIANKKAATGVAIVGFFVLLAIIGPWIAPYDASARSSDLLQPPSGAHWFGTTHLGQDVFSQILVGTRGVVFVGFLAGVIATVLSVIVGVTAGYLGAPRTTRSPRCPTSSWSSPRCR